MGIYCLKYRNGRSLCQRTTFIIKQFIISIIQAAYGLDAITPISARRTPREPKYPILKNMQSGGKNPRNGEAGELALLKQIRARAAQTLPWRWAWRVGSGHRRRLRVAWNRRRRGAGRDDRSLHLRPPLSAGLADPRVDWAFAPGARLERSGRDGERGPLRLSCHSAVPRELIQNAKGRERRPAERHGLTGFSWILRAGQRLSNARGRRRPSGIAAGCGDIVLVGAVRRGKALLRSGARPAICFT